MRTTERDVLLLLLAITSGSADGWSYMGLGNAFVANMTGNTVLLGIGIFGENRDVLYSVIALTCYAFGVAAGAFVTRRVITGAIWSRSISITLFVEALLLLGVEAVWVNVKGIPEPELKGALLGCVAVGIGMQSGAMLRLRIPGIVTTYITGTWTTLVSGLVRLQSAPQAVEENQQDFEERLYLQITFLAMYFAAAIATGWLFRHDRTATGAIAAAPILLVAVYGAIRG